MITRVHVRKSVFYFLVFYTHRVVLLMSTALVLVYTTTLCPSGCGCTDDDMGQINVICEGLTDFPVSLPKRTAQLQILHSNLHSIPEKAFSDSPDIRSVYVRFCNVEIISSLAFTNFRKVEDIEFQRNNITRFGSFSFSDINVSSISISYNNIDVIETHAFSVISANDQIVCSNNFIRELGPASFSRVQEAKLFQFQANTVESVRDHCFTNFSSIETFDFSNNHFLYVEPQSYNPETTKIFIMFQNAIDCDCEISWIFKTPSFARFIDYNYCDDAQEVALSEWYSKYQPLCKSTTTNGISPDFTSKSVTSSRTTSSKTTPHHPSTPNPALSNASKITTTVSSTSSHSKRTSQNLFTQISTQRITDRQSTTISNFVTNAINTVHSGNENLNSSPNSIGTNAPPGLKSHANVGAEIRTDVLATLVTCLIVFYR